MTYFSLRYGLWASQSGLVHAAQPSPAQPSNPAPPRRIKPQPGKRRHSLRGHAVILRQQWSHCPVVLNLLGNSHLSYQIILRGWWKIFLEEPEEPPVQGVETAPKMMGAGGGRLCDARTQHFRPYSESLYLEV